MAEFLSRCRDVACGIVIGLIAIVFFAGHWQHGVNWKNPGVLAWLSVVTAVCLGMVTIAFGLVTGDYRRNQSASLRLGRFFGAIALIEAGFLALFAFIL